MVKEFVTCLNCIDGRVQLPVINWILKNYDVKYVDMITAPGVDGILANRNNNVEDIFEKVTFSIDGHSTDIIFIVGHHDCLANPVADEVHIKQVFDAAVNIKDRNLSCCVTGLWVDEEFEIHKVCTLN
jgi:hypothetical protein